MNTWLMDDEQTYENHFGHYKINKSVEPQKVQYAHSASARAAIKHFPFDLIYRCAPSALDYELQRQNAFLISITLFDWL